MITGNEPAMPSTLGGKTLNGEDDVIVRGLTIRQHFAAMAMQGMISDEGTQRWLQTDPRFTGQNFAEVVAINSCEFSDALIAELNKPKN